MKRYVFFLIQLLFLLGCASIQEIEIPTHLDLPPYYGEKKKILVLDLTNETSFTKVPVGKGIAAMLITSLVQSDRFIVIERNEGFDAMMKEKKINLSGLVGGEEADDFKEILGVDVIVVGKVTEFGIIKTGIDAGGLAGLFMGQQTTARVAIDVRLVNADDGSIVAAVTGIGKSSTHRMTAARAELAALTVLSFGTKGFDETTIGKATRMAINQITKDLALEYINDINKM